MDSKFQVGDKVLYQGVVGIVEQVWSNGDYWNYDLISEVDPELTCTAKENECILVDDSDEIDQSEGLSNARLSSQRIMNLGDSLTDKYFRDGNH